MDKVAFNCMVADYAGYTGGSDVSRIAQAYLKLEAKLQIAKDALREITEDPDTATLLAEHALEELSE